MHLASWKYSNLKVLPNYILSFMSIFVIIRILIILIRFGLRFHSFPENQVSNPIFNVKFIVHYLKREFDIEVFA